MDDRTKRCVNKRQAAMDSEKKWQEAFDADIMYELSLPLKNYKPEDLLPNEATSLPEPLTAEEAMLNDRESFTVLKNSILHELVACLVCPNCTSRELKLDVDKNVHGFSQSIQVCCQKCSQEIFHRGVEPIHYHFRSPQVVSVEKEPFSGESDDFGNKNAEELVCDVDVPDNPFSPCSINGTYSNQGSDSYDETPAKTVVTPSKSDTTSKPLRPCVFCSKMQARLRQHVKAAHWNHPFVINMVRQPPRVQAKLMRQLRSEGILAENKKRLKNGRSDLLRVRNRGSGELTVCEICGGYYKKNVLWRHKATCTGRPQLSVAANDTEPDEAFVTPGPRLIKGELHLSNWSTYPANGSVADGDGSEIDKIREILEGINHGVFSQSATDNSPPTNHVQSDGPQNDEFSGLQHAIFSSETSAPPEEKPDFVGDDADIGDFCTDPADKDNFSAQSSEIAGFISSLVKTDLNDDKAEANEDQLLFDSLPAIINGRDSSVRGSWSDSNEEDSSFDWPEMKPDVFPDGDMLPCYAMYQSKRRKRSRSDFQYQFWKKEHEDRIREYFSSMVDALKVPGKEACQEFLRTNTDITTDWVRVKYKVYNEIQKKKKRIKRNTSPSVNVQQPCV